MTFQEARQVKQATREKRLEVAGKMGLFSFCLVFFYVCTIIN